MPNNDCINFQINWEFLHFSVGVTLVTFTQTLLVTSLVSLNWFYVSQNNDGLTDIGLEHEQEVNWLDEEDGLPNEKRNFTGNSQSTIIMLQESDITFTQNGAHGITTSNWYCSIDQLTPRMWNARDLHSALISLTLQMVESNPRRS